jgi:RNA polymerase sigma-70 factor (ECF subfamily)
MIVKTLLSETELLQGCLDQNPRAQRQLYERYAGKMLAVVRRYIRDRDDADDVLAQGFVKVFRYLHQYEGRGPLAGWIRRVMVHEALKFLRKRNAITVSINDDEQGAVVANRLGTDATAESDLAAADLWRLLEKLPFGYRTVFNLYAVEGFTHPQIAQLLGISEGTSKSQLFKARAVLQQQVAVLQTTRIAA